MNKVIMVGRLTRDAELRQGSTSVTRFGIAVDRRFKAEGQPTADFFNCVAFGKTAEFIGKYFQKGMRIGITGRLQTGSYTDKEGKKVNTVDVVVEEAEFVESLNKTESSQTANEGFAQATTEGFMQIDGTVEDAGLPFK